MKRLLVALSLSVSALFLGGCPDSDVGKTCIAGATTDAGGGSAVINSEALECNSRICYHPSSNTASSPKDLCTDFCGSNSDCNDGPKDQCKGGFACTVATTVGPFCCKKMCVCKDYLSLTDAGVIRPEACNPEVTSNKCVNLPRSPHSLTCTY